MKTPAAILKETFGYDAFLPTQQEVIDNVLAGRDTLAVMPTGGGKSLCYQIPALMLDGLTVVVSPLIALMKDQVEQLRANGVPAAVLNSSLSSQEYQENMRAVTSGKARLLYMAPETLLTDRIYALLSNLNLSMLTIDEAHCISEWGHDFRPEYRQLVDVRQKFPKAVCLALTATATPRVRSDIKTSLKFTQSNEFVASFNRENLYIQVEPKGDAVRQTVRFLERYKDQSGIIYCFSRKQVDDLAAYLVSKGYSARPYHAGLEDAVRHRNQEEFIRDDVQIIVATIAFGMGINKPNVRFVLHYDLPKSIEGYYQEIGRAGRDGLPAHCLLLYSYGDAAKQQYFIQQKEPAERRVTTQHLEAMMHFAEDETNCRRKPLLAYFGEAYTVANCRNCDNCTSTPPALADITIPAQKFLSCVKRTGERFGAGYVTDVLLGSKAEKILQNKHNELSTYGIGKELNQKQWMHLARQLLQMGYLNQNGEHPTLSLTMKANDALRARSAIMGQLQEVQERPTNAKARQTELEYNNALFALLRQKRKDLAETAGVPPYVIFSDKTLVEMAAYYPQTLESMLTISGVGQAKLNQYGQVFLTVIKEFCQKKGIKEKTKKAAPEKKIEIGRRFIAVGEAYNTGEGIRDLMQRYQVTMGTVVDNLVRYAAAGNSLRPDDGLAKLTQTTAAQQKTVFAAFDRHGTEYLKPAFDQMNGAVTYDELKILRLMYLTRAA